MTNHQHLGPPPIEPLPDAVWNRIERGLWSHLDAPGRARPAIAVRRRWWMVAAPFAVAVAIIVVVIAPRWNTPQHAVAPSAGEPARVVSGAAPAAVSLGDVHIELDAETALSTTHDAEHPIVVLEHGGAWFTVAPRRQRPAFEVRAGDATIRVIGTRFRVARAGEHSAVDVEHGEVEARFRGTTAAIGAGQRWSSEAPDRIESIAALPPAAAPTPPDAEPTAQDPGKAAGHALPDAAGSGGARTADRTSPARRPASKSLSEVSVQTAPSTQLGPATQAPRGTQPRAVAQGVTPALVDRDRAEYDRLAAFEPASPEAALTGYLALARRAGLWADPALFAAARLAADRRDHRAKALLELYLTRFPGGANALDAKQLLARLPPGAP